MGPRATTSSGRASSQKASADARQRIRRAPLRPARAGAGPAAAVPPFRFTRLGPKGVNKQLGEPNRKKIGGAMAVSGGGQSQIPAGFTYLGQFIDHDLTFDKTSVMLGTNVTPAQLLQGRSPSARPRLALRRRACRPGIGQVLRGRRPPPEGREDQPGRPRSGSTFRGAPATPTRRSARRSSPIRATTRTSRWRSTTAR